MTNLEKSVLSVIVYYDIFDYPVTLMEVWRWQIANRKSQIANEDGGLLEIRDVLNNLKNKVESYQGFYFLRGRSANGRDGQEIVNLRQRRRMISLEKIKKARRVMRGLRFVPWVKAIFIGSSLGILNATENSDIDFLVITSKNRIWSARFFLAGALAVFGMRPKEGKTRDKFCLGYFLTEDNLNLEDTKIDDSDICLGYLLAAYLPLYDEDNLWEKFWLENNWIKKYLPNFDSRIKTEKFLIKPRLIKAKRILARTQFEWEEGLVKRFQLWKMPAILKEMANKDTRVIVNDKRLKLHSNDKRGDYNFEFRRRLGEIMGD